MPHGSSCSFPFLSRPQRTDGSAFPAHSGAGGISASSPSSTPDSQRRVACRMALAKGARITRAVRFDNRLAQSRMGLPPYSAVSTFLRNRASGFFLHQRGQLGQCAGHENILRSRRMNLLTPSYAFRQILPVKPSVTATSHVKRQGIRLDIPDKPDTGHPGQQAVRLRLHGRTLARLGAVVQQSDAGASRCRTAPSCTPHP